MTDTPSYSAKAREIAKEILRVEVLNGVFDPNCMREAIEEALIKFGTEREAIGYEKGKEDAAKLFDEYEASCRFTVFKKKLSEDDKERYLLEADSHRFNARRIRSLPLPPKE